MDDTGDPLETLEASIDDGWKVAEVASDDAAVCITLVRGGRDRMIRLNRRHARRMLARGVEPVEPVRA